LTFWNRVGTTLLPDWLSSVWTSFKQQSPGFWIPLQWLAAKLTAYLIEQAEVAGAAEFSEKRWIPAH